MEAAQLRLSVAAWVAVATHILAALASLFFLRPGTPVGPDAAARMAYVATHLTQWRMGWASWTLASLSLVALLFALHRRVAWLAIAGLFFDVPAQLALATPLWPLERAAYLSSGVVANGLYTLALYLALRHAALPLPLHRGGLVIVGLGIAVAIASLVLHPVALLLSTGALTVAMIAWSAGLGVWAWQRS